MKRTTEEPIPWQRSRILAFVELALIAAIYLADWAHYIFLSKILYLLPLDSFCVWRGTHLSRLMNRIADLIGNTRTGWVIALTLASLVFGLAHFQQGNHGGK